MTSPLDALVSGFRSATSAGPGKPMPLALPLERIKSGTFQPQIADLRALLARGDKPAYDQAKKKLPAFTPAGVFTRRANARLTQASGLVHFDFDHPPDLQEAKARLMQDPLIVYVFVSPSGAGLKVAVWADGIVDDRTYKQAWNTVLAYFERTYPDLAVANDKACKDIARLCFVSHDPDLYSNPDARLYGVPPYQEPAPKPTTPRTARTAHPQPRATGEGEQARLEDALWHIPADDYDTWLRVGMALHSTGEAGARALWDTWSQRSEKYDTAVQQQKWASFTPDGGTHIGTVFHLAQQYGYAPPPRATLGVGARPAPGSQGAPPLAGR